MEPREQNVRAWSMLTHFGAFAALIFPPGLVLGPLIIWQIKKNELPEIDRHGKEAVNFQLTIVIINVIGGILVSGMFASGFFWRSPFSILRGEYDFLGFGWGLATVAILFLWMFNAVALILALVAGIRANDGKFFRYPFAIRFIK